MSEFVDAFMVKKPNKIRRINPLTDNDEGGLSIGSSTPPSTPHADTPSIKLPSLNMLSSLLPLPKGSIISTLAEKMGGL